MKTTLISEIASKCNWDKTVNDDYRWKCDLALSILQNELPSGSGIDCGCKIDVSKSSIRKVIITFDYHFLNENGFYDGWESYKLTVIPTLIGFGLKITGKNKNMIKDYFYDTFDYELSKVIDTDLIYGKV